MPCTSPSASPSSPGYGCTRSATAPRITCRWKSPASTGTSSTSSGFFSIRCSICWSAIGELRPHLARVDGVPRAHRGQFVYPDGAVEYGDQHGHLVREGAADRALLHAPARRRGAAAHCGAGGIAVARAALRPELERLRHAADFARAMVLSGRSLARDDGFEFLARDAPVAVAIDRDPVVVQRRVALELVRREIAVAVAVELAE